MLASVVGLSQHPLGSPPVSAHGKFPSVSAMNQFRVCSDFSPEPPVWPPLSLPLTDTRRLPGSCLHLLVHVLDISNVLQDLKSV